MEITGRIKLIGGIQNITASFQKRELILVIDEHTQYPQPIAIEFTQANCSLLDTLQVGEMVNVSFNLRGREWTDPQGNVRYFNSIQGWRINKPTQEATPTAPNNTFAQAATAAAVAPAFATTSDASEMDDSDDLPF